MEATTKNLAPVNSLADFTKLLMADRSPRSLTTRELLEALKVARVMICSTYARELVEEACERLRVALVEGT